METEAIVEEEKDAGMPEEKDEVLVAKVETEGIDEVLGKCVEEKGRCGRDTEVVKGIWDTLGRDVKDEEGWLMVGNGGSKEEE